MTRGAWIRRFWGGLVLSVPMAWAVASAFSDPPPIRTAPSAPDPIRRVLVENGRASFDLAPTPQAPRWLVVVSSLSRESGPFPVTLHCTRAKVARTGRQAPQEPRRPPNLTTFVPAKPKAKPRAQPAEERTFSIMVRAGDPASASNYLPVRAKLRAVGKGVQIYLDERERDRVNEATLGEIIRTFDDEILPASEQLRGTADDTDGDGRFTILLSGWLAHLGGGRLAVDGFMRGADLDPDLVPPFGNRCDMLYLSTTLAAGPYLKTVLAHEYAHVVTFSHKRKHRPASGQVGLEEEGWLDEAISHLVEDRHGYSRGNIDYRVDAFLAAPERYSLVVDDYFRADLFRSHGHRGATYLFLRWCEDQFGPKLVPTLMQSSLRGIANLENATGRTFADLYREWSVSVAQGGTSSQGPPNATTIVPDGREERWDAAGTSSRYFVVELPTGGVAQIDVDAPPEAALQISAVPIAADRASLRMTARRSGKGFRLGIRNPAEASVVLESLEWSETSRPIATHGELRGDALAKALGSRRIAEGGSLRLNALPIKTLTGALTFKLSGRDRFGKPVRAWATCDLAGVNDAEAPTFDEGD